ncbi:aminoglycoside phosphotransferase family protein [Streptomyces sp. NPDC052042]|uniref:aminoglycoside phosphotransferase family protein n=1 Tax=Streptomyces sp. NPDC052042 TaxID=3365683 RepID=UPI0037D48402
MIDIPDELIATQSKYNGETGRAFIAALPRRAAGFLERWGLRRDGAAFHGMCALVLPVVREADGRRAVLKLQPVDEETAGEPVALRVWGEADAGAVELLDHDPATGTMLLERLDGGRSLAEMADEREAVRVLAGLLARLSSVPAPPGCGLRRLGDVVARLLEEAPGAAEALSDEAERRLLADCAAALREVAGEPGDRMLHWDLHYGNVLAREVCEAGGVREAGGTGRASRTGRGLGRVRDVDPGRWGAIGRWAPHGRRVAGERWAPDERWVAIDPKPLIGDPGFELLPALVNRFDAGAVRWRFDLLTEALGLDRERERARAWTLGRLLQNGLWAVSEGERRLDPEQVEIARVLLGRG